MNEKLAEERGAVPPQAPPYLVEGGGLVEAAVGLRVVRVGRVVVRAVPEGALASACAAGTRTQLGKMSRRGGWGGATLAGDFFGRAARRGAPVGWVSAAEITPGGGPVPSLHMYCRTIWHSAFSEPHEC